MQELHEKKLRLERGMITRVAKWLDISHISASKWLSGEATPEKAFKAWNAIEKLRKEDCIVEKTAREKILELAEKQTS